MMPPTKKAFERAVGNKTGTVVHATSFDFHPQPRFYKHYWQIYTPDLPWEGDAFFENAPVLSTAAYLTQTARYDEEGKSYVVYGFKRPRLGPGVPFDPSSARWSKVQFAPAFEDDPDPIAFNGHR